MIEKLEPHKILPMWQQRNGGCSEAPPTNWELMEKINEIIEHINEMEEK